MGRVRLSPYGDAALPDEGARQAARRPGRAQGDHWPAQRALALGGHCDVYGVARAAAVREAAAAAAPAALPRCVAPRSSKALIPSRGDLPSALPDAASGRALHVQFASPRTGHSTTVRVEAVTTSSHPTTHIDRKVHYHLAGGYGNITMHKYAMVRVCMGAWACGRTMAANTRARACAASTARTPC